MGTLFTQCLRNNIHEVTPFKIRTHPEVSTFDIVPYDVISLLFPYRLTISDGFCRNTGVYINEQNVFLFKASFKKSGMV